ncbi:MAG: hypothetical protein KC620_05285, partial [Myxococcales bacterium]|nr:hypothetical protein [Myxococcales bacterium]
GGKGGKGGRGGHGGGGGGGPSVGVFLVGDSNPALGVQSFVIGEPGAGGGGPGAGGAQGLQADVHPR